jgi:Spy/CpxP family protein refolding chaperone
MKTYWKYIAVSLALGWFIGAASSLLIMRYCGPGKHFGGPGGGGAKRERLYKKLNLSPEQKTKVNTILKDSREKLDKIYSETRPKMDEIRNATKSQIRAELTADQQAKFDQMNARREERRKKRMERREKWRE